MNFVEDPNDDTDNTHMDIDAMRCLWALYYCRCPDLINLGCIHLPIPFNCAWGVLSHGPYNAADVVNLLKTRARKGDTEEDVEGQCAQIPGLLGAFSGRFADILWS